jgi:hypothetical protein
MRREAGPPAARAFPEPTKRPVPVMASAKIWAVVWEMRGEGDWEAERGGNGEGKKGGVPIEPPIAIICKCLTCNFLAKGDFAVLLMAVSTS